MKHTPMQNTSLPEHVIREKIALLQSRIEEDNLIMNMAKKMEDHGAQLIIEQRLKVNQSILKQYQDLL